jgi:hypothetical protein
MLAEVLAEELAGLRGKSQLNRLSLNGKISGLAIRGVANYFLKKRISS